MSTGLFNSDEAESPRRVRFLLTTILYAVVTESTAPLLRFRGECSTT